LAGDIHHPAVARNDACSARHVAENDRVAGLKVHLKDAHQGDFRERDGKGQSALLQRTKPNCEKTPDEASSNHDSLGRQDE
jgi:hypothetical protein